MVIFRCRLTIWLLITIFYLLAWILFGIINFAEPTRLVALAIWEKIASKENTKFKDELYSYWSWFKQNHEEQKQRRYWNENSEWYEGRKFYFRDAEPLKQAFTEKQSKQNHKQESNKQENKQQDYEKAYDEYKQKHDYTGQEESKSYQNNQSNKQQ